MLVCQPYRPFGERSFVVVFKLQFIERLLDAYCVSLLILSASRQSGCAGPHFSESLDSSHDLPKATKLIKCQRRDENRGVSEPRAFSTFFPPFVM